MASKEKARLGLVTFELEVSVQSHFGLAPVRVQQRPKFGPDVLEQLRRLWNTLRTKPLVYGAIFSNFQA
jgi:hypothetical protein